MGKAHFAAAVPDVRASAAGIEDAVQRRGECNKVTVVDAAVLQLASQLAQQRHPVPTRWRDRGRDLDPTLDDLDSCAARGCGPHLLPRAVTAGG
jgi:hypothetical protein